MNDDSMIEIRIPTPWGQSPIQIRAFGFRAVLVAATATVAAILVLALA